ncbi:MSC_0622 family F1-like ATPase gamma subunit [Mesomycoplasma lagogenitalium]|uniref:ATP synthase gamma chain n=1 Tax=Mesomycoplasma lagogenitalium TaxID=171286 RepID=A0ABY8LUW0_9BACT|nr:hypothetical protein [Mesomycoplasma lagogenitalium]WGI37029.1 hypothetical protein QEG99_01960 [Mesomycoplasma lagogenitalium]
MSKIENSLQMFESLKSLTNISKLKTISEISLVNKDFEQKLNYSLKIRDAFLYLKEKYKLNSEFLSSKKNQKKLWIYLSEDIKIKGVNYNQINHNLKNQVAKNDLLFVSGDEAIKFAKDNNFNIIFSTNERDRKNIANEIYALVYQLYLKREVNEVIFVLNTNRSKNNQITILPMEKMQLIPNSSSFKLENEDFSKKIFFPAVADSINSYFSIYLFSLIPSLVEESHFFKLKQKLLSQIKLLNELDEKIKEFKKEINEQKRQELTEEIMLLSQTIKGENENE